MNYRENKKNGDKLSVLGFGCLRFPTKNNSIDEERTEAMVIAAIEKGVNYFDTAYVYNYGKSESILGRIISKGYRERVKIATKLPHYLTKSVADIDKIFNKQLKRLQTDYIDYYLIHMLSDVGAWERLRKLGIEEWIENKKKNNKILNIGFSFHGVKEQFIKLVDIYDWDFCQIQYNYLDENNQAGTMGLKYAASKGLPIIIMEPLRGGKIVNNLPREVQNILNNTLPNRSAVEWALRWVWNHPEVTVVLSGMSNEVQVEENISIASAVEVNSFSAKDMEMFEKVKEILKQSIKVNCTACGYCLPCPVGVDIPACFSMYNEKFSLKLKSSRRNYMKNTGVIGTQPAYASLCIKCGKCESHCPQEIPIREKLVDVSKEMEGLFFKPFTKLIKLFMKVK